MITENTLDSGQIKSIELQLANQVRDNFAEFMKGLNPSLPVQTGEVAATSGVEAQTDGQAKDTKGQQSKTPEENSVITLKALQDVVVMEKHQGKSYAKLMREGKDVPEAKEKEQELLSILDEVDQATLKSNSLQDILHRPAPTIQTEFDEEMLFELIEQDEDEEQSSDSDQEDSYEEEDEEDDVSVKETNPGYFSSLVTKI